MLKQKVISTLKLIDQISEVLAPDAYPQRLGALRSNSIGHQLWCLAGARESYLEAVMNDSGFRWTCTFKGDANSKAEIDKYLKESSVKIAGFLQKVDSLSSNQQSLLLDLLAHEYQHQGQLIRYLYGNKLRMPDGWRDFWHLEQ